MVKPETLNAIFNFFCHGKMCPELKRKTYKLTLEYSNAGNCIKPLHPATLVYIAYYLEPAGGGRKPKAADTVTP